MEVKNEKSSLGWKDAETVEAVKELIDQGIILTSREVRRLKRLFKTADEAEIIAHMANRIAERIDDRLPEEILVESLLLWLASTTDESLIRGFITELLDQSAGPQACVVLVDIALTADIATNEDQEELFAMAVALTCEIGLALHSRIEGNIEKSANRKILDHISTYLLSVSNTSNSCIRLSLMNYFGRIEQGNSDKAGFNRIMSRFGHTVLENLFTLLFSRRTEAVALQYLLENVPYILDADNHSQKILHETCKYYMLKRPERFSLFIQALAHEVQQLREGPHNHYSRTLLQHLALLLKVAGEVNHKGLGESIIATIMSFGDASYRDQLIAAISKDITIRLSFREELKQSAGHTHHTHIRDGFRAAKRGRKPSLSRSEGLGTLYQVNFLGNQIIDRAS